MPRVLWRDAQGIEGSADLTGAEIRIGRAMDCAIRTEDAMVSRHHARLYWAGGQYYVEDLGSANGVYYQEQRVSRHALNHGDAVRCGSLWLRFVDSAGQVQQQSDVPLTGPMKPVHHQAPQVQSGQAGAAQSNQAVPVMQPSPGSQPNVLPPEAEEELRQLRRRVDQLQTELRMYRKGRGPEVMQKVEDLENENASLEEQNAQLKRKVESLESTLSVESSSVKAKRADAIASRTSETVDQLNDVLSNLRINVKAAEGVFEQVGQGVPRASYEAIRENLRAAAADADSGRELLRALRDIAD